MSTRNPPGTGMLRLAAAILLVGAPVFGIGAIVLGVRQVRLGEHRSERFLGVSLLLGGAFTMVDGVVRLLLGT